VDLLGYSGVVLYSRLSTDALDAAVHEQIDYFRGIGQEFEWKAFAHDPPVDLVSRLDATGFEIDESEAVMVLDLESFVAPPIGSVTIRHITTRAELRDAAYVKQRVYRTASLSREVSPPVSVQAEDATPPALGAAEDLLQHLAFELENAPDYLSVYIACLDDVPAATGWIRFPEHSAFASLWGGSTLPELRNRGLYTALLWARVDEARRRGFRYVTVDAGAMSRPILEKRGFRVLTYATACTWHG
jgi:GNAT superfamily N-acetyltransferase